jgi:transposase
MITRDNSFKLPLYYIFLEDTKHMTILTRQERERLVLDLYNQGKTIREIAKEARMSFRDIGVILNKAVKEKKTEGIKQQDGAENNQNQEQEQHLSLSAQAYKLFSDRKTPLEVAVALNLRESEVTKFYKEYWKLKQLHNLNMVYEELRGDIEPFLKLYKLAKRKGMGLKQVVNLLEMSNNDLPDIQCRYERLKREVNTLEFNEQQSHIALSYFNNQIEMKSKALTSYRISCIRERREIENLYNEKARLVAIVTGFKSNNEEYLDKIEQAAEEKIKEVLTNGKFLLQFAIASVIESLRSNPELCNFMMYYNSNNTAPSFMSGGQQQQKHQEQSFNGRYAALILEEAEKLYNTLKTELTNRATAAVAAISASPLPSLGNNTNNQKLAYKIDNTYQT